jgi:hypothetical protein
MPSPDPVENPHPARGSKDLTWNLLTILVVLATFCMLSVFAIIFFNPDTFINPLPPKALPAVFLLPTPTNTLKAFPATWTPTITEVPTETPTPPPPAPTETQFVLVNSMTRTAQAQSSVTPTLSEPSAFAFAVRSLPAAVSSTIIHPDQGCKWLGVGGQVFDLTGATITGSSIRLGGSLNKKAYDMLGLSGTALQYGPAGYEFFLSDTPVDSKQSLWVQLYDQAGLPLSEKYYFDTHKDCQKNLVLINFKQVK